MVVILQLSDVRLLCELVGPQSEQDAPVPDEVTPQLLGGCVVLQHVVALRERHHELRAEQTAGPNQARKTLGWKTPAETLNNHLLSA